VVWGNTFVGGEFGDFHLMSPIIASSRIIIKWGNCVTEKLSRFYQWTEAREKFKLKDGKK